MQQQSEMDQLKERQKEVQLKNKLKQEKRFRD